MKSSAKLLLILAVFLTAFARQSALTITSTAFTANGMLPAKYSCEGAGVSPPLTITGMPQGTRSLAIIVHDPDAPHPGGVTHWVAWNLPLGGNIPENFKGSNQGMNSDNQTGYKAICPPSGAHHYHFRVYALDTILQAANNTDKAALEKAMQGHILAQGDLVGLYAKSK
jgi:Raf kinase inhibitor-like YbhB/YbcL family protein